MEVHLLLRDSDSSAPLLEGPTQAYLLQKVLYFLPSTHCSYARTIYLFLFYSETEHQVPSVSL